MYEVILLLLVYIIAILCIAIMNKISLRSSGKNSLKSNAKEMKTAVLQAETLLDRMQRKEKQTE